MHVIQTSAYKKLLLCCYFSSKEFLSIALITIDNCLNRITYSMNIRF